MENKKTRIFTIILLSFMILTGAIIAIASRFLNNTQTVLFQQYPYIKSNLLVAGFMVVLAGAIFFLKLKELSNFFQTVFEKIYMQVKNENRLHLYFLIFIIIAGAVFRIFFLFEPVRYSEAIIYTKYISDPAFVNIFPINNVNSYMLNSIFISFFHLIFGTAEWVIRIPSILFGIAIIPSIYLVSRYFYDKQTAVIAAAIASVSPFLTICSADASGTTLNIFCFLIALALAKFLKDNDSIFAWLFFILTCSTGFFNSPSFIFAYLFIIIWLISSIIFKDTAPKRYLLLKKISVSAAATFALSFLMYVPFFVHKGAISILTGNFVYLSTIKRSFIYVFSSLKTLPGVWNNSISSLILVCIFAAFVIVSLIFHKAINYKYRVPLPAILLLMLLLSGLTKISGQYPEAFTFIIPLVIIAGSYGLSIPVKKIKFKNNRFGAVIFPVFSLIIAIIVFSFSMFANTMSYYHTKNSAKGMENAILDIKNEFKQENIFLFENDLEFVFKFYLDKHNISEKFLYSGVYPEKNIYIFIPKSLDKTPDDALKSYWGVQDPGNVGFVDFEQYGQYDSITVYKTDSIDFSATPPLIDFNGARLQAETKNFNYDLAVKEIILESKEASMLSYFKMPLKLRKNTDYLVMLEIKNIKPFDNTVNFDFFGNGYDNIQQEHIIEPKQIKSDFSRMRFVMNSGEVPGKEDTFFRIYSYGTGIVVIKNLNVFEIGN